MKTVVALAVKLSADLPSDIRDVVKKIRSMTRAELIALANELNIKCWSMSKQTARKIILNTWPELILVAISFPVSLLSNLGPRHMLIVTALLIMQNASFTIVSRARQSSNLKLHAFAAIGSNGFFIFIIATVAAHYDDLPLKLWYIVCTVVGSVHAHHISLHKIEKAKMFKKDSLVTRSDLDKLEQRMATLEGRMHPDDCAIAFPATNTSAS
jgi:hypothetical protein